MIEASGVNETSLSRLRRWNLGLTLLHALQAVAVLVLANGFVITVTSQFPCCARATRPTCARG